MHDNEDEDCDERKRTKDDRNAAASPPASTQRPSDEGFRACSSHGKVLYSGL